ncbi:MAG: dehydrogenase [Verrucomicrobiales bacterium]|nr:dehydrogenase [Verrucomicrobiales bacterium]
MAYQFKQKRKTATENLQVIQENRSNSPMQRRRFIEATAVGALAAPFVVRGAKRKIRIGQIGTSHSHASGKLGAIRNLADDFELVGIAQPREVADKPFPNSGVYRGVKRMTEEDLLASPGLEAVAIETEVPRLVGTAKRAVEAGMHIHHDKPGGSNLSGYRELIRLAKSKKRVVQMGYMLRYNPAFQFMYRAVKDGWLGEIMEVDAMMGKMASSSLRRELARYEGGGMFELACHLIDSVVYVLGKPSAVHGFQRDSQGDGIRDNQLAILEYEKATAAVRCNHRDVFGFSRRRFQIAGDKGVIEIRPMEPGNELELSLAEARGSYSRGTQTVKLAGRRGGRYDGEFADLAKVIRGEKEFDWSYEHDLAVQETVLLASGMPLE